MTPSSKKTIGLLSTSLNSYFVQRLHKGVEGALLGRGYRLEVFETSHLHGPEHFLYIDRLAEREDLAGLIYGHLHLNVNQVAKFKQRGIPVVACTERMEGIDWVTVDEILGACLATRWLLSAGHRRIALVNGPLPAFQARQREDGFIKTLSEFGIEFGRERGVHILSFSEDEGYDAGDLLLGLADLPSAVFVAAGDVTALGVMHALRERGVDVPGDISVIGYDNLDFAAQIYPALTTVNQPLEAMGAWAGRRMAEAIQMKDRHRPQGTMFAPELVLRGSARPRVRDMEEDLRLV